ncbi:helix-turn-helix transcriptional regulator [Cytobacillus gottheilii]|uniref:Helix-turn-helix domain-containing protein n=1 Tax=Cytobacillus gottheilii TaxID=859144 RepID=A0ABX8FG83_9BACI|nr:helix-turn-helix domain-containing protein [Cytobacillus gottheilii]
MRCKLKDIRKEQGWTQKWLAQQIGVSDKTMSEIITEKSVPTLQTAIRIAKVVGVPVEGIWTED